MTEDTQILVETGAKEEIGIVDEPLEKRGEDSLKIKKYSNALVTFIKNSLTPMTIGIQGSWGSGKTSLLNTIYACYLLEPPSEKELQKISELQQLYNNKLNVEEYSIMTLWCCTIYYIDNLPKIRRQKTWP